MKKLKLLTGLTALFVAAGLGACASPSKDDETPSPSPSSAAPGPVDKVTWVDGDPPALEFAAPFQLDQVSASRVVKAGEGAKVAAGQPTTLDYVAYLGEDGSQIDSTYTAGQPYTLVVTGDDVSGDVISQAVLGQRVGAQVIAAWQGAATGDASAEPSTYLIALTIVATMPGRAEGEALAQDDPSLPAVTLDQDGKPSIRIPPGVDPPAELVREVLIEGTGQPAAATDTVFAHYTGWLWDGAQFDSSWDRGSPSEFSLQQVVKGWTEGLTGLPTGSQVLLVIPPGLGYGDAGQGDIPGGATLVFVVDLLAIA
ncbi:MAG: FKBP-type peptidyl-prolyl cis-trans isomerase [Bifidobacteriaceae bacterium]|jgi:peptidylprolyl isomerase|nr:FKBP-type peptidyl-prolyl cis-trans isomerase [Bifidobacteriaceae bacterium]